MSHVHITSRGRVVGTLFLDEHGHVADDGTPAAINAMDHTNHGFKRHHGQAALDGIVAHLDRSTYVGAHHCGEDHRHGANVAPAIGPSAREPFRRDPEDEEGYSDDRSSTEPTAQDPWPEWGEVTNEDKHHELQWGDSGNGLVE